MTPVAARRKNFQILKWNTLKNTLFVLFHKKQLTFFFNHNSFIVICHLKMRNVICSINKYYDIQWCKNRPTKLGWERKIMLNELKYTSTYINWPIAKRSLSSSVHPSWAWLKYILEFVIKLILKKMYNLDEEKIECALGTEELSFWQGKNAQIVLFYFWRLDSWHLFVSDYWYCQIQTTRI